MFALGGLVGALGFRYAGFIWVVPLAIGLLMLAVPPLFLDWRRTLRKKANIRATMKAKAAQQLL